jgi:DNA-binding Xre family transcriptional regulator
MGLLPKKRRKLSTGYEKLVLDVRPLLDARGVKNIFTYLKKTVRLPSTFAYALSTGKAYRISNQYMEQLCITLNCTPNDLYIYTADPDKTLAPNHALTPLHQKEIYNEKILNALKTMPIHELEAFYKQLVEKVEG